MSKPKASPIKASRRTFPVEVLWCGNLRQGSGKGWSFPPNVEKFLRAECARRQPSLLTPGVA